ncbi:hypothetical protein COLO4_16894 [Corchorus olitorius]|uniref:Uncharacterized protein n=1 Tax=Corchorus olitorius TaxID=93759 RepID=A0A1R3JF84_9ROSI|nr:hypothetical protein COLO4_16894 [Corchorus olitorius]
MAYSPAILAYSRCTIRPLRISSSWGVRLGLRLSSTILM